MSDLAEPTMTPDGYPTAETLDRIRTWPVPTFADMHAAMDFAGRAWHWPRYWERADLSLGSRPSRTADAAFVTSEPRVIYAFSTGGWSGNEAIVAAIEANQILQSIGAWSWRRGGHYEYRFPVDEP